MNLLRKLLFFSLLAGCICLLAACHTEFPTEDSTDSSDTEEVSETVAEEPSIRIVSPGEKSDYRIVYDQKINWNNLTKLSTALTEVIGTEPECVNSFATPTEKEIIIASSGREETAEWISTLEDGEFLIKVVANEDETACKVLIVSRPGAAQAEAVQYFIDNFISEKGVSVPPELEVRQKVYTLITTDVSWLRDPYVLIQDGVYYMYGTGWGCYKNTSGDLQGTWEWVNTVASVADPARDGGDHWAPEVYFYQDAYYMFTTYKNNETGRHGCTVMKSDSPEGPFLEITDGTITPSDWDAIDGTLYIDPDGQPWMVFVHEWISAPDGVGSFAAAKLSDDLTHFITEPIELFSANEPSWATSNVTDGCYLYTTEDGELLMLWSNFDQSGYVVAISRSSNGRLDGEWTHEKTAFYSKSVSGTYDGGHGMIFTDTDGQMYLAFHSPNTATTTRSEKACFLAIEEQDNTLIYSVR